MTSAAWFDFNAAIAAAAAGLLGLLFVAVSINAAESLGPGHETSRHMAEQAFQNYLTVLTVSLVALFPDETSTTLGQAAVFMTAISSLLAVARLYLTLRQPLDWRDRWLVVRRHGISIAGFAMLIYAAVRMALGDPNHRDMFAVALIVLLSSATVVSWGLLLRLARRKPA